MVQWFFKNYDYFLMFCQGFPFTGHQTAKLPNWPAAATKVETALQKHKMQHGITASMKGYEGKCDLPMLLMGMEAWEKQ